MSLGRAHTFLKQNDALRLAADTLPSGLSAELFEVLIDNVGGEAWLRFRFLAPQIGEAENGLSFEAVKGDFEHLCGAVALPYMSDFDLQADVIVIALLDRKFELGETNPEATQLIEAFRVSDDGCAWEGLW